MQNSDVVVDRCQRLVWRVSLKIVRDLGEAGPIVRAVRTAVKSQRESGRGCDNTLGLTSSWAVNRRDSAAECPSWERGKRLLTRVAARIRRGKAMKDPSKLEHRSRKRIRRRAFYESVTQPLSSPAQSASVTTESVPHVEKGAWGPEDSSHTVAERLINAQEEERARIGRELHDGIGQEVALLVVKMQTAAQLPGATKEMTERLSQLANQAKKIGTQLQAISHSLHPCELEYLGLSVAVESSCREFSRTYDIDLDCSAAKITQKLDRTAALALYRVLQEALHNVAKHSHARDVKVELFADGDEVVLCVRDSGDGFDFGGQTLPKGLGLISMRERAYSVGGRISMDTTPGKGTRIEMRIPILPSH